DADSKGVQFLQPDGVGDGQIVAGADDAAGSEDGAILALAGLFAYPPPQVFRMDKFEGLVHWSPFDLAAIDPIAISLQKSRSLARVCSKKLGIARLVEPADRVPVFFCHIHIFRVAVGTAFFAEFYLENIQQ